MMIAGRSEGYDGPAKVGMARQDVTLDAQAPKRGALRQAVASLRPGVELTRGSEARRWDWQGRARLCLLAEGAGCIRADLGLL
jgi:hypothetical protein